MAEGDTAAGDQVEPGTTTASPTQPEMGVGQPPADQTQPPAENAAEPTVPGVPQETHDQVLADLEAVKAERDSLQDQLDEAHAVFGDPELAADEEQPAEGSTAAEGLPDLTPSDELKQQWAEQGYVGDPPEEA